jgi:hypothetical protein
MRTAHRQASNQKRSYRADPFAMWKVVARTTGFNEEEQTACALPVRVAWESLIKGQASETDIATLTDVIAICIIAAEPMDALVQETVEAASNAMKAIADRYTRCQRWGVYANALRDIPPVIEFYEELLRNATGGQMEAWVKCVQGCKARMV